MDEKTLLSDYLLWRENKDNAESVLKNVSEELKKREYALIEFLQNREQTRTGDYEGMGSVSIRSFNTYKVTDENKDKLLEFLKEKNLDGVVKQTIHHKTFDRICGELIEEGVALPEFVESYNVTTLQVNR